MLKNNCLYLFNEGLSFAQLVIIPQGSLEERADACVIGQHQARHPVRSGHIGRLAAKCHLNAGGTPGDEAGQLALAYALKRFVHLSKWQLTSFHKRPSLTCVGSTSP